MFCALSKKHQKSIVGPSSSIGIAPVRHADGRGFDLRVRQHSFVALGHEIISTVILSIPLIQVCRLSATDKMM